MSLQRRAQTKSSSMNQVMSNQQENLSTEENSQDQSKVDTNFAEFLKNQNIIEKDNVDLKAEDTKKIIKKPPTWKPG